MSDEGTRSLQDMILDLSRFWSERGAVGCASHMPSPNSDTWRWERWLPLTVEDAQAWRSEMGELPQCECCGFVADTETF